MRVDSAMYVKSAMRPTDYPRDRRPEFAFAGRSNVGKSSLLNALLGKKGIAKTSSTPGKTQTVNFFDVNNRLYFVDLPGYGYAKVPLKVKAHWGRVVTSYLRDREALRLVVLLVDARHAPTERDLEMLALLDRAQVPTLVVATKVDKLKRSERKSRLEGVREVLGLDEDALIVPFSAQTGEGKRALWSVIDDLLTEKAVRKT